MTMIGPANPFIRTEVDVAFDADLTDPADSWDWTTLGDYTDGDHTRPRVLDQTIDIAHGRRDESNLSDPTTVDVELGNGDGALTPYNASSSLYPGLVRGTPLRVVVKAGSRYLALTGESGSNATTPDAASWNIGADLAAAVQFRAPVRLPPIGGAFEVFGQSTNTGNQRSWLTFIAATGAAGLRVSADGATESESLSSLAIPSPDAGPLTVAWVFDGNNGAGGNTTTFYVCRGTIDELLADPDAFTFGDPDINSGTITLHNSTGTVGVGDVPGAGFSPYPGGIDRIYVRAGTLSSGTVVTDADFTVEAAGTTSFADDAATPKTWTVNSAEITDRHPRFLGRVDDVTATWDQVDEANPLMPTVAHVKVSASGILEGLTQSTEPLRSALYRRITAPVNDTTVYAYWPLEDGRDSTRLFTIGGTPGGTMAMSLASDDTLDSSDVLPSVSGGEPFGWNLSLPAIASTSTWEFTMLVNIPVAPDAGASEFLDLCRIDTIGGVTSQWVLRLDDSDWRVFAKDLDGANVLSASGAASASLFGEWMIVTLSIGLSGANITWDLDMIPLSVGAAFGGSGTLASLGLPAGRPVRLRNLSAGAPQEGFSAGHFIVTTGAVPGWLAPADTAYVGEPAPERVFRLCREAGIPVTVDGPHMAGAASGGWDRSIAAGAQPMGPQRPDKLLALLEECAVVDHGILSEQRGELGLSYRSGVTMLNQSTRLRLERARRQVVDPFELVDDDQRFANDVTASRPEGSSYRVADPALDAGTVERYERSVEVNVADDAWLPLQAGWRYHLGTWQEPRFPQVASDIAKTADLVDDALGFALGDRLTVPDPPPGCPAVDQLADGIVEGLERFQWRVAVNGRPAAPWDVGVIDGDTPTTGLARVGTDGSELAEPLTDSQTGAVDVDVTGALWTTDSDYFPLDVEIEGEVVTLSAISGGSSPQTFTISARSVNGVTRAHGAGETVEVAVPIRVAI